MRAEITFEPSAKQKLAVFTMRMAVLHPAAKMQFSADESGIKIVCAGKKLVLERT